MKGLEDTLDKISKWICTTVSSEIGMKPEEALTTDGISTQLYGIQNVGWKLHKNTRTGPVLCCFSLAHKHTHIHIFRADLVAVIWPRHIGSCCFVGSYRARRVKMPHSWRRAEKWVEGQGDRMKTGGAGNQHEEHSKAKGVCSVCPEKEKRKAEALSLFQSLWQQTADTAGDKPSIHSNLLRHEAGGQHGWKHCVLLRDKWQWCFECFLLLQ